MRKILLLPSLLITISAFCQANPTLKGIKETTETNKITIASSQQMPLKQTNTTKIKKAKTADKKLTVSKPTDHLFDIKNEPE